MRSLVNTFAARALIAAAVFILPAAAIGQRPQYDAVRIRPPTWLAQRSPAFTYAAGYRGNAPVVIELYESEVSTIAHAAARSLVRVSIPRGRSTNYGSGVMLQGGAIITAAHVTAGAKRGSVRFNNGTTAPGAVIFENRLADLAIIAIDKDAAGITWPGVQLAERNPARGDRLVGYGYGGNGRPVWMPGHYVAPTQRGPRQPYTHFDFGHVARSGDSGGPVYTPAGQVAGVLWGTDPRRHTTNAAGCELVGHFWRQYCPGGRCPLPPGYGRQPPGYGGGSRPPIILPDPRQPGTPPATPNPPLVPVPPATTPLPPTTPAPPISPPGVSEDDLAELRDAIDAKLGDLADQLAAIEPCECVPDPPPPAEPPGVTQVQLNELEQRLLIRQQNILADIMARLDSPLSDEDLEAIAERAAGLVSTRLRGRITLVD